MTIIENVKTKDLQTELAVREAGKPPIYPDLTIDEIQMELRHRMMRPDWWKQ